MTERSNKKKYPLCAAALALAVLLAGLRPGGRHRSGHSAAHGRADRSTHPNAGTRSEPPDRGAGRLYQPAPGGGQHPHRGMAAPPSGALPLRMC